jgi:taurine dioxygenase
VPSTRSRARAVAFRVRNIFMLPLTLPCLAAAVSQWYGAAPPATLHPLDRLGWNDCARCSGAERLGAIVDVGDVRHLSAEGIHAIHDAVRAHGVICLKGQNLTRQQQVDLTSALGDQIILPKAFRGQDPEPDQPSVARITNFWHNGTHKTFQAGSYWHQDGQFWKRPLNNIASVLYAEATPPSGGETGFADMRAARATLSPPLLARAANASIRASVLKIGDIKDRATAEDLAAFPDVTHRILDNHVSDGGPLLYVGSEQMEVVGLESAAAGKGLLAMLLAHATSPAFTYYHVWEAGDVLVWDNAQVLHHAFPYDNDGTTRREFYRTQAWMLKPRAELEAISATAKDEL